MVSPSLRTEVIGHIFQKVIKSNNTIFKCDEQIEFVTNKLSTQIVMPEENIVSQGDLGHRLYFLARGNALVFVKDEIHRDNFVRELKPGDLFGEVALINKCRRTATVMSSNYCTVSYIDEDQF